MNTEELTTQEAGFLSWLKLGGQPTKIGAKRLINDLEDTISELRMKVQGAKRMAKNGLYCQIENRQAQIRWAEQFL